jgi:hypothetical protein
MWGLDFEAEMISIFFEFAKFFVFFDESALWTTAGILKKV